MSKAAAPASPSRVGDHGRGGRAGAVRGGGGDDHGVDPGRRGGVRGPGGRLRRPGRRSPGPGSTTCRRRIPVRVRIHASSVSSRRARSPLVTTRGGTHPASPHRTAAGAAEGPAAGTWGSPGTTGTAGLLGQGREGVQGVATRRDRWSGRPAQDEGASAPSPIPPAITNTAVRMPSQGPGPEPLCPTRRRRATSTARPTAPPTWRVVDAMPEAMPWSPAATPAARRSTCPSTRRPGRAPSARSRAAARGTSRPR